MSVRPRRVHLPLKPVAATVLLAAAVTAAAPGTIVIRRGDTLSRLAVDHGTTVAALQHANHLRSDRIYAGRTLVLPGATGAVVTAPTRTGTSYRVAAGDTLTGVAKRFGLTRSALAGPNHLSTTSWLIVGTTLSVPTSAAAAAPAAPAGRTYPSATVRSADRHRTTLATRKVPSKSAMRSLIAAEARRWQVDPALALAVAYQESGYQMRVVSAADAIGAMQVLPATADWMSAYAGRRLDPLNPLDNATTGVLLLKWLTARTSSDKTAVAGYYQGLASVQQRGMFTDTKQYVASVSRLRASGH